MEENSRETWAQSAESDSVCRIRKRMEMERGHHLEMIEGLTREYESVFLVDINAFSYQTLRLNERLRDFIIIRREYPRF